MPKFINICSQCTDDDPCITFCDNGNFECMCEHKKNKHLINRQDSQPVVKELTALHLLLKSITDPWADLGSGYSTHATRRTLRVSVMKFYKLKRDQCMVLGRIRKKVPNVITAHIYPKSMTSGLKFFDLAPSDINNPKNCLRLVANIERAFDEKHLTIIQKHGTLIIFVLNKTLLSRRITRGCNKTFRHIHGLPLRFNNEQRPFHRLLALHCHSSFVYAKSKQNEFSLTDDDLANFDCYVNELLEVSFNESKREKVKQWLYNNPVGPGVSVAQAQISPDVSYTFVRQYNENLSNTSINNLIKKSSELTLSDLAEANVIDESFLSSSDCLSNQTATDDNEITKSSTPHPTSISTEAFLVLPSTTSSTTNSACSDADLVKLFRSVDHKQADSNQEEKKTIDYIREKLNSSDENYIQIIILSYLESCLVSCEPTNLAIDEFNAEKRTCILNQILQHNTEKEIQILYATQKFIVKLNNPPKMARLLFEIFYDEDCVSEETFWNWHNNPNRETDRHKEIKESTKAFFTWLALVKSDSSSEEEDANHY